MYKHASFFVSFPVRLDDSTFDEGMVSLKPPPPTTTTGLPRTSPLSSRKVGPPTKRSSGLAREGAGQSRIQAASVYESAKNLSTDLGSRLFAELENNRNLVNSDHHGIRRGHLEEPPAAAPAAAILDDKHLPPPAKNPSYSSSSTAAFLRANTSHHSKPRGSGDYYERNSANGGSSNGSRTRLVPSAAPAAAAAAAAAAPNRTPLNTLHVIGDRSRSTAAAQPPAMRSYPLPSSSSSNPDKHKSPANQSDLSIGSDLRKTISSAYDVVRDVRNPRSIR